MIDYQLKHCCEDCTYSDIDCSTDRKVSYDGLIRYSRTVILCHHQDVCGKYNEVAYKMKEAESNED